MNPKFNLKIKDHINIPEKKKYFNEKHFSEVARRYDFVTRAMSLGQDAAWKRYLMKVLPEVEEPFCLDLACGTGDITFLLAGKYAGGHIVGLDLTEPMLKLAGERNRCSNVSFTRQDMCETDFDDESFDIVTGGYALRNAPDIHQAFREIHRVLKPGGAAAFLDFSKSSSRLLQNTQYWLLKIWCSFWGLILHGNPEIHGYIAASLRTFPNRARLRKLLEMYGFELIHSKRFYLGIMELFAIRKTS